MNKKVFALTTFPPQFDDGILGGGLQTSSDKKRQIGLTLSALYLIVLQFSLVNLL